MTNVWSNPLSTGFILLLQCILALSISPGIATADDVTVERSLAGTTALVGEPATVTVTVTNSSSNHLRGFIFSDHTPAALTVTLVSVKIDGAAIPDFTAEATDSDAVTPGCRTYRWVFETPGDYPENNPIKRSRTAEIVYTWTASQPGNYACDEFSWVGLFPEGSGPVFGYSQESEAVVFTANSPPPVTRLDVDRKIKEHREGTATEQEVKDLIERYMETQ